MRAYWIAHGHLLQLLNRKEEAREAFGRAASLTSDPVLREYLSQHSADDANSDRLNVCCDLLYAPHFWVVTAGRNLDEVRLMAFD